MTKALKYLNLIFFLIMICVNILANLLPIGYGKTGDISSKYPNLFTPAPFTFSIWGVIYILVALFIVHQLGLFTNKDLAETVIKLIGPWFIISCAMNVGWILSWHYDIIWLSLLFILGLLLSLIMITSNFNLDSIERSMEMNSASFFTKVCICGFNLYLGWITAATIANISVLLVKVNWNRFGLSPQLWSIVVIAVGTALGILFVVEGEKYMSAIGIIWAYCGILGKHISQSGYGGEYLSIIIATIIGIVFILTAIVVDAFQSLNTIS